MLIRVNLEVSQVVGWGALDFQNLFHPEGKKKKSLLQKISPHPEKPKSGVLEKNINF